MRSHGRGLFSPAYLEDDKDTEEQNSCRAFPCGAIRFAEPSSTRFLQLFLLDSGAWGPLL